MKSLTSPGRWRLTLDFIHFRTYGNGYFWPTLEGSPAFSPLLSSLVLCSIYHILTSTAVILGNDSYITVIVLNLLRAGILISLTSLYSLHYLIQIAGTQLIGFIIIYWIYGVTQILQIEYKYYFICACKVIVDIKQGKGNHTHFMPRMNLLYFHMLTHWSCRTSIVTPS